MIRAIVTDIEGTTSAVSFVFDVLFPYAAQHLPAFIREHAEDPEVAMQLGAVRLDSGEPEADVERVIEILQQWIAEDRKATPLKALQGMIWKQGYETGELKGLSGGTPYYFFVTDPDGYRIEVKRKI